MTVYENIPIDPMTSGLLKGLPLRTAVPDELSDIVQDTLVSGELVNTSNLQDAVATVSAHRATRQYEPGALAVVAAKGFARGIPETLMDYVDTIRQTSVDVKQIVKLEADRKVELDVKGTVESRISKIKRGLGKASLIGWYASIFPAYQLFDDAATYPLYVHLQEEFGSSSAYGLAAVAGFGLASATGLGQRSVEKAKANLMQVETSDDVSDHGRRMLDASVNSSMWQVALSASKTREAGEAVPIVTKSKVAQYAGAYALANTALYAGAESLPVGEWTGFGISLAAVWALGGAYSAVKQHLKPNVENI